MMCQTVYGKKLRRRGRKTPIADDRRRIMLNNYFKYYLSRSFPRQGAHGSPTGGTVTPCPTLVPPLK